MFNFIYFCVKCVKKCVKRKCNNRLYERDVEIGVILRYFKIY